MHRLLPIFVLTLAGCLQQAPVPTEDGDLAVIVADHENRISRLEGDPSPGPSPVIDGEWQRLTHNALVAECHIRAKLLREAASKEFTSQADLAHWLLIETTGYGRKEKTRIDDAYRPLKTALEVEFDSGWSWARHREILLEQAEFYESVK